MGVFALDVLFLAFVHSCRIDKSCLKISCLNNIRNSICVAKQQTKQLESEFLVSGRKGVGGFETEFKKQSFRLLDCVSNSCETFLKF